MISVYDVGNTNFEKLGDAVLMPLSAKVRMVAGGSFELTLEHPIDPDGKWSHLTNEAIIKTPVPAETITTAWSGQTVDAYKTNTTAALRDAPSEPSYISYPDWVAGTSYAVGTKVTSSGRNYQLLVALTGYEVYTNPAVNSKWSQIASWTSGGNVLANLKNGTELILIENVDSNWYKMSTTSGLEGYIKKSQVTFYQTLTPSETEPRTVTTQLFRIKEVSVETKEMKVTVNAVHVSYDLNGVLVDNVKITRKGPAAALAAIEEGFMINYQGTIATNYSSSSDTSYSGEIAGKSGMFALLDPDKGVVPTFDAAFRRDNWDLFVMKKTNTNRGFRITYGNNMMGVVWNVSTENLITRVVPVAKAEDGTDLYLSGTKWVNSSNISSFPVVYMERLKVSGQVGHDDGTETGTNWTTSTLRAEMQKQASARFSVDKVDVPETEITIDFERLGDTVEYAALKPLQRVVLYDTVTAVDPRIGLNVEVTVNEIEFDAINERITALKLSNVSTFNARSVSGFMVMANTISGSKLTDDASSAIEADVKSWVQDNYQPLS